MPGENHNLNLKDTSSPQELAITDTLLPISYTKTNKLITGLYMVTDIMDKDEPLRNKLRTLGTEIIMDIQSNPGPVVSKTNAILSFLDIGSTLGLISQMNAGILKKEFLELKQSVLEYTQTSQFFNTPTLLSDLFKEDDKENNPTKKNIFTITEAGRPASSNASRTRIGVQKGHTLLRALSDKTNSEFDVLKKQRRQDITAVIKINGGSATITDIKSKAQGQLLSCSEKTLQRELILMVKEGVLKKTGKKRWSRYFLAP